MNVKIFLNSAGHYQHQTMLTKFLDGVQVNGLDTVEFSLGDEYSSCDVAIMFGSWKDREKGHHLVRSSIAQRADCFVVIETPLLNRSVTSENTQWRVGVNGFLNNQGLFVKKENVGNMPTTRYNKLNSAGWQGWKDNPDGHIVLLLQLAGDASLRRTNIYEWAMFALTELRKQTDRKILIRPHPLSNAKPGDEFFEFYYNVNKQKISNVEFVDSKTVTLKENLKDAYCSIAFSSGSSIDSIVEGIPVIACDPGNFAWSVSSKYPNEVNRLLKFEPQRIRKWLDDLAWSQWSVTEMQNGTCWEHLRPICQGILDKVEKKKK